MALVADAARSRREHDDSAMIVISHAHLARERGAGVQRLCAVGSACGITRFEAWLQTIDPGASSAPMRHPGEQAVLVLAGSGKLLLDGAPQRFASPCTLVVPPGTEFRIVNDGAETMQLVGVLAT